MSKTGTRHTTIDTQSTANMGGSPTKPDRVYGASNACWKSGNEPRLYSTDVAMRDFPLLRRPADFPVVSHGFIKLASPWTCYQRTYRLRFGVGFWMTGARQLAKPCDEVFVQELPATIGEDELQRFLELRHPNIHAVLDVFEKDKTRHVVFEHMEISLHEIATVGITTTELATILGQVIDGLVYLSEQGMEHGSLTCSNILVSREGTVKLGECERCRPPASRRSKVKPPDVTAFGSIAAQLMGGHVKPKGATCLPDLKRWHNVAAMFLADTNSAMSVHELQNHDFLKLSCMPEQLKSVVSRVIRTARIHVEDVPASV